MKSERQPFTGREAIGLHGPMGRHRGPHPFVSPQGTFKASAHPLALPDTFVKDLKGVKQLNCCVSKNAVQRGRRRHTSGHAQVQCPVGLANRGGCIIRAKKSSGSTKVDAPHSSTEPGFVAYLQAMAQLEVARRITVRACRTTTIQTIQVAVPVVGSDPCRYF